MISSEAAAREAAKQLAGQYLERGDALGWFDELYRRAGGDWRRIPWAHKGLNPNLQQWLDSNPQQGHGRRAVVVGCGLGDDAERIAACGFQVLAFDISATAVAWCRQRHPRSSVHYEQADLFQLPSSWRRGFDFVLESYTLQALPVNLRREAVQRVADLAAPNGAVLVICRGCEPGDPRHTIPWPLHKGELAFFEASGLVRESLEDYLDEKEPPQRRFRALYRRPG